MNELKGPLRPEADTGSGIIFFGLGNAIFIWEWRYKGSEFWIVMSVVTLLMLYAIP